MISVVLVLGVFLGARYRQPRVGPIDHGVWNSQPPEDAKPSVTGSGQLSDAEILSWLQRDLVSCLNFLHDNRLLARIPQPLIDQLVTIKAASEPPAATLSLVRELRSTRVQDSAWKTAFQVITQSSPRVAFDHLPIVPAYLREAIGRDIVRTWLEIDAAGAIPELAQSEHLPESWLSYAIATVAKGNAKAIFEVLIQLPEGPFRKRKFELLSSLLSSLVEAGDPAVSTFLDQLNAEQRRSASPMIYQRAYGSPELLSRELTRYPRGLIVQQSVLEGMRMAAFGDFEMATRAANLLPGVVARQTAFMMLSQSRARMDIVGTAKWADAQSDPFSRAAAIDGTVFGWLHLSPQAATSFALERLKDNQDPQWMDSIASALIALSRNPQFPEPQWIKDVPAEVKMELKTRVSGYLNAPPRIMSLLGD